MLVDKAVIIKYSSYFHDGSLIDIQYRKELSELIISMWSAEMDPENMEDPIPLSHDNRIRGKLHLTGVKEVQVNDEVMTAPIKMLYDSGDVFAFEIKENKVILMIKWLNFPPKERVNDFSTIKIEVEEIFWENIIDLKDPFFPE